MRAPWLTWVWPIIILLSTIAVTLITFLFPAVGIRPVVIMGFLFLIPGMTIARFFRTGEIAVEWMLAIVLSFTLDAFVAGIILYTGQWSPTHIMSFLIGFCFSGAIAQLIIIRPIATVVETVSSTSKDTKVKINPQDAEVSFDPDDTKDLEASFDPENMEDPDDTKELPTVSLQVLQSFQQDTQEKTVPLVRPELSGKEA